jgi:hypothetical protein
MRPIPHFTRVHAYAFAYAFAFAYADASAYVWNAVNWCKDTKTVAIRNL